MNLWAEIRTAYHVGKHGTISAAAQDLGIHRATVLRHIDTLEAEIGEKLFHRHRRGYTPTELGAQLIRVASESDDRFASLLGKIRSQETSLTGDFIITSLDTADHLIVPLVGALQANYPDLKVCVLSSPELFRLEYGEAHVAFRFGPKPDHPDHVVRHFANIEFGLYASKDYVKQFGRLEDKAKLNKHRFLGPDDEVMPPAMAAWMRRYAPPDSWIFRSSNKTTLHKAIFDGLGIGYLPVHVAGEKPNLVEMITRKRQWVAKVWLVSHIDLHRSAKVQAFLSIVKDMMRSRRAKKTDKG